MSLSNQDAILLNEYSSKYGRDEKIVKVEQSIIESKDYNSAMIYASHVNVADFNELISLFTSCPFGHLLISFASLCGQRNYNVRPLQDAIISMGNPSLIHRFAYVKGADVNALLKAVFQLGDYDTIFRFLKINGVDVSSIEDYFIIRDEISILCRFAEEAQNLDLDVNVRKIQEVVLSRGDINTAIDFALNVRDADVKACQDYVENACGGSLDDLMRFAEHPGADIKAIERAIINAQDPVYAYILASQYSDKHCVDILAMQEVVINSGNSEYIQKFCNIEGADIHALTQAILKTGNIKYIPKLIFYTTDANDLKQIQDFVISSGSPYAMSELVLFHKGKVDVKLLQDAIIDSGNLDCMNLIMSRRGVNRRKIKKAIKAIEVDRIIKKTNKKPTIEESVDEIISNL